MNHFFSFMYTVSEIFCTYVLKKEPSRYLEERTVMIIEIDDTCGVLFFIAADWKNYKLFRILIFCSVFISSNLVY